jgi:peptidoglycan biosynthesis protein MviN/MurJ (putative lipid II flippase)
VIGYVAVSQVGVVVATRIANAAGREGGLGSSAFGYASLLFQMPYGIIGVALLTALLPRMSRAASRHDVPGVVQDLSLGTRLSALGLLPVTAALAVLGPALGILAFARGNTSVEQAEGIGVALAIGALGNIVGAGLTGQDTVWDLSPTAIAYIVGADLIGMVVGFMLGVVMRNSAAAIVSYFSYWFVVPTLSMVLAANQAWFEKAQPWVDFNYTQGSLTDTSSMTGENWAQLGLTGLFWLAIPLAIGLWSVFRSEVK